MVDSEMEEEVVMEEEEVVMEEDEGLGTKVLFLPMIHHKTKGILVPSLT